MLLEIESDVSTKRDPRNGPYESDRDGEKTSPHDRSIREGDSRVESPFEPGPRMTPSDSSGKCRGYDLQMQDKQLSQHVAGL